MPRETEPRPPADERRPGRASSRRTAEDLARLGIAGALSAQWQEDKRRTALQRRYGEEADVLVDDTADTAFQYFLDD